jgi:hypothetical protein
MLFEIEPHEIKQTATKLQFEVVGSSDTEARIYYKLIRDDGQVAKDGHVNVPLAALAVLGGSPIDVTALNAWLADHGISVTTQILPDATT